ncbi:discoidin domain-containing protein [Ruania halotolerans]|uniref:discoidin domain-containing protein n=1 Tax=Ruania halotolerans TaxID=2897773 RepID=UPI001E60C301|nr:discoidin domain-containing protein [Ruania halotolerans]UFU06431.1 discoidin domain-containing protein [Ruania halotolerans]
MRIPALMAVLVALTSGVAAGPAPHESDPARHDVTFMLGGTPGNQTARGVHHMQLVCDDEPEADARLHARRTTQTETHSAAAGSECSVDLRAPRRGGWVYETIVEVRAASSGAVLHRATVYDSGQVDDRTFIAPGGDIEIRLQSSLLRPDQVGTELSVMAFNLLNGGRLDEVHGHGREEQNVQELLEFVRHEDPDVLFSVETYGTGDEIVEALNGGRADDRVYRGVQLTREPGQAEDRDNLWLFTHLPVEEIYPVVDGEHVSSFNFGGARLTLPDGSSTHAFSMWLSHRDNAWSPLTRTAIENVRGLEPGATSQELAATDRAERVEMADEILSEHLPQFVTDESPVIVAGDTNALSPLDWSEQFADAPGHEGLVVDWPAMGAFEDADFTDTYREANPDAARFPGRTFSASNAYTYAPARIDYILTRGDDVRVLGSSTRVERLPQHQRSALDDIYPFYSDHAAVVSDLLIRGTGPAPSVDHVVDEPISAPVWPEEPGGTAVPPSELSATASTQSPSSPASRAVDGDVRTHWHSDYADDPPDPQPHTLTIDMGTARTLAAVRYVPRIDGFNGIATDYRIEASTDGSTFTEVAAGSWNRDQLPRDVDLPGVEARYLRLVVERGVGLFSTAAEVIPYERLTPA